MTDQEKLERLDILEKKINKIARKGYKIASELKVLSEVENSSCPGWCEEGIERFLKWGTDAVASDRKWIYRRLKNVSKIN